MGGDDSNGDTIGIRVWRRVKRGLWLGWAGWCSNGRVEVERCGGDAIEYGCDCSGYRYVRFAGERGGAAGRLRAAACGAWLQ